jgi:hypothetical protein
MGRAKNRRREMLKSERKQTHGESILTSTDTVMQYHRLPNQDFPQKNLDADRKHKFGWERGWGGRFKTKRNKHTSTSGCRFFANSVPRVPLFPQHLLLLDNTFFIT